MEIIFAPKAYQDLVWWKTTGKVKIQKRISDLITSIQETPFTGIGKPEALKYDLSGCWSRRINQEHRLIYEVKEAEVHILSLRDHY